MARDKLGNLIRPAESVTQKALKLPKGRPSEWDGKPVSTFPGRKIKPIPGQLTVDDAA